jgi:hypothetical protein
MTYKKDPKSTNFSCENCNFICDKKSLWDRHLTTAKHLNTYTDGTKYLHIQPNELISTNSINLSNKFTCDCGKKYNHRQSLFTHKKKCLFIKNENDKNFQNEIINISEVATLEQSSVPNIKVDQDMILELMKQNQEFKQLIVEQQQEMQKQYQEYHQQQQESQLQFMELVKDNLGTHNTNSHNNITNNFNLNLFLNETCKDAMNITDFIDSLQVHFNDLEYNGENGYAAGISKIFLRELNQLDICKRPIHCSDVKREVFHIKNKDCWEKERELLIKCIKQITKKNVILLSDWREAHPGCMDLYNKHNDQYNKINCETMGPYLDHEELRCFNKIISNIAKATVIDKKPKVM